MQSKNIIIAPCGNKSFLFQEAWLKYKTEKEFDTCLLFYHEQIDQPDRYGEVEYFHHLKGFKYHMIHELLTSIHPEWLEQYDYFYFLDDDINIDTRNINILFSLSKTFNSSISCAALTLDSFCSWPIFKQKPHHFCRYIGQIEVMAPLFNKAALQKCLPTFNANKSSWGLDSVWSKILDYPEDKLIVFDAITMKHIYPVGKGELYEKIGVDPHQEWADIIAHYDARTINLQEYKRLYMVDKTSNPVMHLYFQFKEAIAKQKQTWRDRLSKARSSR